jgi:hypothetical protein
VDHPAGSRRSSARTRAARRLPDDIARATQVTKGYLGPRGRTDGDLPARFRQGLHRALRVPPGPCRRGPGGVQRLVAGVVKRRIQRQCRAGGGPAAAGRWSRASFSSSSSVWRSSEDPLAPREPSKKPAGCRRRASAPTAPDSTPFPAREVPATAAGPRRQAPSAPPVPATRTQERRPGQHLLVRAVELTWCGFSSTTTPRWRAPGRRRARVDGEQALRAVGNAGGSTRTQRRLAPLGNRGAVVRELILPAEASPRS